METDETNSLTAVVRVVHCKFEYGQSNRNEEMFRKAILFVLELTRVTYLF